MRRCSTRKVEYIHNNNNPVNEGLVTLPEHYIWSSAHPESPLKMFEDERHTGWLEDREHAALGKHPSAGI